MQQFQAQAKIFKSLMHPVRLSILDILRDGEQCVCHMEAILNRRQAYISQHLSVLREAGLVQDRRDGWNIFYRVTQPEIYAIIDSAGAMAGVKRTSITPRPLGKNKTSCPCPKCNPETELLQSQNSAA